MTVTWTISMLQKKKKKKETYTYKRIYTHIHTKDETLTYTKMMGPPQDLEASLGSSYPQFLQ